TKAWNPPRNWVSPERIALARIPAVPHLSISFGNPVNPDKFIMVYHRLLLCYCRGLSVLQYVIYISI
ncbi:hypothetical protein QHH11_29025, partial [Aphanizomenon sp. PH219]|nr:hypothetical protein [Aphanizomenon sp. PH219]